MARVERVTSTQPVPVERAQLAEPFRFSTVSAQVLQQAGGVLAGLGKREMAVLEELERRKIAADDSLAINATGESRTLAKLQMQQFMLNNPDPDKWSEGLIKILGEQRKVFAQQKLSPEALANEQIEQEAFANKLRIETQIAITTQTIENAIAVSGKNLVDVIANDDGSTDAAADIDKQIKLYQDALERRDAPEVAAIHMEETLQEAEKLKAINARNLLKSQEKEVFDLAMTLPEKEGIDLINKSGLPLSSIKSVRVEYTTQKSIQRNEAERETKRIQDETRQSFVDRITSKENKNQIRDDMLLARATDDLTEDAFTSLSAIINSNVIDQGDPQRELELSKTVRIRPETITKDEIYADVGKGTEGGVSLATANALADKWQTWKNSTEGERAKDPKTSAFAKRGHDVIDVLEDLGKRYGLKGAKAEKDWKTTADIAEFYNILNEYHDALDVFMDTNPAPQQTREFVDNLLITEKQSQAENSIRRWWRGHMPDYLGGKAGGTSNWIAEPGTQFPRPKSETEFNAQVAAIEDEDESRAFYNLWKDDFK